MDMMNIGVAAFAIALLIGLFLYFRPHFIREGFTTVALGNETFPKCIARDTEAQSLLAEFQGFSVTSPNSTTGEAYAEFKLILQKLLCMDADITGAGAGVFSSYSLPFATAHDIEPPASFVGRCVRHAVRARDVEVAMDKYEARGLELLKTLCFDEQQRAAAATKFHSIVVRISSHIQHNCLMEKATLDIPAGPRDPGYFTSNTLTELAPFEPQGRQWI